MAFERPQTAQQAVLAELRRAILVGELLPGTQIVQEAFAERLGLSRVPVREALKILEGEGQVTYEAHHGYFVTKLDLAELVETYRMRELLESDAAEVAAGRMTDEDLARMEKAAEEVAQAASVEDISAMIAANRRFHFTIFDASGMTRFAKIIGQLWDATEPYRSLYYTEPTNRDVVDGEHRSIVEAAREGDSGRLTKLLAEHRQHAIDGLKGVLEHQRRGTVSSGAGVMEGQRTMTLSTNGAAERWPTCQRNS